MAQETDGAVHRIGKAVYVLALMSVLGFGAVCLYSLNIDFWQKLVSLSFKRLTMVVLGSALLAPMLDGIDNYIKRRWPMLEWSFFSRNLNFVPMDYWFLRVPFLILLYFNLPVLAWVEEMIFRHDWIIHPTSGWLDATWRSVLFAVLHVPSGAKIRSVLALSLGGLWFSWQYMQGGVESATLAHLAMNTTGLTLMLVAWARSHKNPFAE